jgi:proteasome assembly chaperone (PAC2) family protein
MLISISEACKMAHISRTNFYKNYIDNGKISVSRDERNRPKIDTSELLRVFGKIQGITPENTVQNTQDYSTKTQQIHTVSPELSAKIATLEAENRHLSERLQEIKETLQEAKDRESWQRGQIEKLTDTIKLLEAPRQPVNQSTPKERFIGFINRFLGR